MNDNYKYLYNASIDDIRDLYFIRLEVEDMLKKNMYDKPYEIFKEMLENIDRNIFVSMKEHNEKYGDDITIRTIKASIVGDTMNDTQAKEIILYIEKTGYKYNDWEQQFIDKISQYNGTLSARQSFALRNIYEKAVGGGRYQNRQII